MLLRDLNSNVVWRGIAPHISDHRLSSSLCYYSIAVSSNASLPRNSPEEKAIFALRGEFKHCQALGDLLIEPTGVGQQFFKARAGRHGVTRRCAATHNACRPALIPRAEVFVMQHRQRFW
jgi:hypothetical protein